MKLKKAFLFLFPIVLFIWALQFLTACEGGDCVVNFSSEELEEEIRKALNQPTGSILCTAMASLTNFSHCGCEEVDCDSETCSRDPLDPTYNPIYNVNGLQHATNLVALELQFNEISNISNLSGLTKLQHLDLNINDIVYLSPLAGLTSLQVLELVDNDITNISPLSGLTNLQVLKLDSNLFSNISALSGLINISQLDLSDNLITDISPLLDNAGLSYPDTLDLEGNPLSATSCTVHVPELVARGVSVSLGPTTCSP